MTRQHRYCVHVVFVFLSLNILLTKKDHPALFVQSFTQVNKIAPYFHLLGKQHIMRVPCQSKAEERLSICMSSSSNSEKDIPSKSGINITNETVSMNENQDLSKCDNDNDEVNRLRKRDLVKTIVRRLANLSLLDYSWRSDFFKKTEADRRVEESLARMMGEENAAYVRPMDAGDKIGPLGLAEKKLVEWLYLVIEEEGRRAKLISSSNGDLVRPMDLINSGQGGPLSNLENSAVEFLDSIRNSEKERVKTKTLRPKDLQQDMRGPLGDAEFRAVVALNEIREAEELRMTQSRLRGGDIVRPIDVPGPLGEMEGWYISIITEERERLKERMKDPSKLVRPKDNKFKGPLGLAEQRVSDLLNVLKIEETERLRSIQRVLRDNRPMDTNRESPLGLTEAFLVGLLKGPLLMFRVMDRVKELMQSNKLDPEDAAIIRTATLEDGRENKSSKENEEK